MVIRWSLYGEDELARLEAAHTERRTRRTVVGAYVIRRHKVASLRKSRLRVKSMPLVPHEIELSGGKKFNFHSDDRIERGPFELAEGSREFVKHIVDCSTNKHENVYSPECDDLTNYVSLMFGYGRFRHLNCTRGSELKSYFPDLDGLIAKYMESVNDGRVPDAINVDRMKHAAWRGFGGIRNFLIQTVIYALEMNYDSSFVSDMVSRVYMVLNDETFESCPGFIIHAHPGVGKTFLSLAGFYVLDTDWFDDKYLSLARIVKLVKAGFVVVTNRWGLETVSQEVFVVNFSLPEAESVLRMERKGIFSQRVRSLDHKSRLAYFNKRGIRVGSPVRSAAGLTKIGRDLPLERWLAAEVSLRASQYVLHYSLPADGYLVHGIRNFAIDLVSMVIEYVASCTS